MQRALAWLKARAAEAMRGEEEKPGEMKIPESTRVGMPRHLAIIMDGNRRYAKLHGLAQQGGHEHGFGKLTEVLEWCSMLGITHVSVYAFSSANFKRSDSEVSTLMRLAESKLLELADDQKTAAHRLGIRVRIEGCLADLPWRVQRACARAMQQTRNNSEGTLHVCMAYSGDDDMRQASAAVESGIVSGLLQPHDRYCRALLERCLWSDGTPPVDLLIRTSGVTRLSGFLLWQCRFAYVAFLEPLWPEITFADFLRALLAYKSSTQSVAQYKHLQQQNIQVSSTAEEHLPDRAAEFLHRRRQAFDLWVEQAAACTCNADLPRWPLDIHGPVIAHFDTKIGAGNLLEAKAASSETQSHCEVVYGSEDQQGCSKKTSKSLNTSDCNTCVSVAK